MKIHQYRPLLFQELDLTLPGLKVFRLSLNRHFPQNELIESHVHPFDQFLLYLTGGGFQKIQDRSHLITPGTLVYLPAQTEHSFHRGSGRRPLCLVLNFRLQIKNRETSCYALRATSIKLTQSDLTQIRNQISILSSLSENKDQPQIRVSSRVLQLMEIFLRSIQIISPVSQPLNSSILRSLEKIFSDPLMLNASIPAIAKKAGYQKDYLNRRLKKTIGLTMGQYQSQRQFDRARQLLRQPLLIQDAANELGFSDQNYFARWFKKQSGMSPRKWRSLLEPKK